MNLLSLHLLLEILMFVVKNWWKGDVTNSTGQGISYIFYSLTSSEGYKQIIDKLTRLINNSVLCIDLTFCTKPICDIKIWH